MIKRFTSILVVLLSIFTTSFGQNTIQVLDKTYKVDTLFHAKVGPGTTQTSLTLSGPGKLTVFYLTVDLKNPLVSVSAVEGNDKLAGCETPSSMAVRKSVNNKIYFAGTNADFFATSGTAENGISLVGTPTCASVCNGEIYKTSSKSKQFAIDKSGTPYIGYADFTKGTISCGTNSAPFKCINVGSADNSVSLYTPKYYGVSNQKSRAGACAEVTAKLVAGESLTFGRDCKFEITSTYNDSGNTTIPSGEYVIHGRGTTISGGTISALDFVKGLKVGDIVTITPKLSFDGNDMVADQLISGNPKILGNGERLDTEGERTDASALHPRTSIGYSADKTKLIMMVVDGRSTLSSGVRTSQLADIMHYAGAAEAMNLDGGGSSCLYTRALGVRNAPSDGKERAVGNGIFAVADAPEDNEIAEIRFKDWAMKLPKYATYKPVIYGYNKYGIMVNDNVEGYTLESPAELGTITDANKFLGSGEGTYALKATYKGCTATIPVTIVATGNVQARLENVINDSYHDYVMEVQSPILDVLMPISPEALTWESSNPDIVTVGKNTGVVRGLKEGEATIKGVVGNSEVTTNVKVEIPTGEFMPIDADLDASTWSKTQSGGTGMVITPFENGMKLTYTGASSRVPSIKLTKSLNLYSLPDAVRLRINPGDAVIKTIVVSLKSNTGSSDNTTITTNLQANQENEVIIPISSIFDVDDMAIYPLTFNSMTFNMGAATSGKEYVISIPGFEAKYSSLSGVNNVEADNVVDKLNIYPNPVNAGAQVTLDADNEAGAQVTIYNMTAQQVSSSNVTPEGGSLKITAPSIAGVYIVEVMQGNQRRVANMLVR